jgi:RNA polymerase sigma factor (sigma-70 family)
MSTPGNDPASGFVREVALAHGSALHRFLIKRLRAGEDAQDVAQEVYLRLLRLQRTDLIRQPAAYIYFLASQIVGEHRLRASRQPVVYDSEMLDHVADAEGYARRDELPDREHSERVLKRALMRLSTAHRNVILLRKRDGFSIQEIADRLQMSPFKVRRYLVEANARIENLLRQQGK